MTAARKNPRPKKRDHYTVALEGLRSDFKVFGEGLGSVVKDVGTLKEDVHTLKEDVQTLKDGMTTVKSELKTIKQDVGTLKNDMTTVKSELRMIRHDLKEKVGREEFKLLEQRVEALEKVKSSR